MSIPEENKFIELFNHLPEFEKQEVIDFTEYLIQKRNKTIDEAFKNVSEVDEPLTDSDFNDITEARESGTISYSEMWKNDL